VALDAGWIMSSGVVLAAHLSCGTPAVVPWSCMVLVLVILENKAKHPWLYTLAHTFTGYQYALV